MEHNYIDLTVATKYLPWLVDLRNHRQLNRPTVLRTYTTIFTDKTLNYLSISV